MQPLPVNAARTQTQPAAKERSSERLSRNEALDVLRGLAVVMVLFRHAWFPCPEHYGQFVRSSVGVLTHLGWAGVDLFFVISGFLVSGLLFREYLKEGRILFGHFFMRRGLKIYPGFYVLVVGYGAVEFFFGRFNFIGLLRESVFIQNYFDGLWNHTWSLAVEEHFYLGLGVTAACLAARKRLDLLVPLTAVLLVFCLGMRFWTFAQHGASSTLRPTHLRIDALMFGVMLSYFYHFRRDALDRWMSRWWPLVATAVPLLLWPLFVWDVEGAFFATAGFTTNYLGFGALLLLCVFREAWFRRQSAFRLLSFIGYYSYSVYLWHMLVSRSVSIYVKRLGWDLPYWTIMIYYFAACIALGWGFARLVEQPALRFRDRIFPSRSGGLK